MNHEIKSSTAKKVFKGASVVLVFLLVSYLLIFGALYIIGSLAFPSDGGELSGFSSSLMNQYRNFGFSIPEKAQFVAGYSTPGLSQDPVDWVQFTLPEKSVPEDISSLLLIYPEEWEYVSNPGITYDGEGEGKLKNLKGYVSVGYYTKKNERSAVTSLSIYKSTTDDTMLFTCSHTVL